ncbi:MAG: hypothetical protein J2P37_32415 [Ktedonobacteraceae bacterium]|nr:hypothetical protein [Ktedonobacteraceae bacterium]
MFSRHLRMLSCASLLLSLVLICFFCAASPARAASQVAHADPISISAQTAKVTFPKGIDFQVTASDFMYTIRSAILYVQFGSSQAYRNSYPVLAGSPAKTVTLKYHLNTTGGSSYVAPGGQISYHWMIQDNGNNSHSGSTQSLTVADSRFSWQHLDNGMLQINWYQQTASFGQTVMNKARDALTHIASNLGGDLKHPTKMWLYQSDEDFRSALPSDTEEWTGGLTLPNYNVAIFVINSPEDEGLTGVMPHEMTHLVFHQLIEDGIDVPIWFDEGLAVYNELGSEPELEYRFKQAVDKNALLPLSTFSRSYPSNADKADLAYAQSWKLMDYMYRTFGKARMSMLIRALDQPFNSFDQDLGQTLGVDTEHLESQWHVSLHLPPTIKTTATATPTPKPTQVVAPPVVTEDSSGSMLLVVGLLLVVVPLVGLGGLFFYIRRTRERERVMQQAQQIINMSLRTPRPIYPPYVTQVPPGQQPEQAPFPGAPQPRASQVPGNIPMTPPGSWQGSSEENPYSPGFQEYSNHRRNEISQE